MQNVDFIVRSAPDDGDTLYLANVGTQNIYYSNDAGETSWALRYCNVNVRDLAVESAEFIYVATQAAATVAKSDSGGFIWDSAESTGNTGNNHMIKSLGEDLLIVGSTDGYVAYSNDGNDSWTAISAAIVIAPSTLRIERPKASSANVTAIKAAYALTYLKPIPVANSLISVKRFRFCDGNNLTM